jgi:branched-chain amino acid transport system permease protein
MTLSRRVSQYLPATVLLLGLLSFLVGGYIQFLTGFLFLFIIQGYVAWLLFYKAGQSFYGYSAFMIVGAYTCVVLQRLGGVPLVLQIVLGALLSSLIAIVFFLCTSRAKGFYAGMASFLLAILMPKVVEGLYAVTGGRSGVQFTGLDVLWGANNYLLAVILITVAIVAFIPWLCNTRAGKVLTLVAENEPLALAAGINSFNYKLLAYGIAGLLSGLGGGLYINYMGSISSIDITVFTSVSIFFMPLLGSKRSPYGPIVGAMFVVLIPELFSSVERYLDLLFGLSYIVVMVFLPEGIIVGVGNLIANLRRRMARPKVAETSVTP